MALAKRNKATGKQDNLYSFNVYRLFAFLVDPTDTNQKILNNVDGLTGEWPSTHDCYNDIASLQGISQNRTLRMC